jgi:hypothetical protein
MSTRAHELGQIVMSPPPQSAIISDNCLKNCFGSGIDDCL